MTPGKQFEKDFEKSCKSYFYRLKDGTSSWGNQENTRFQAKNDFDCFIFKSPHLYGIELKSVKGKSFPFSNLKDSQIKGLLKIDEHYNGHGYLIINFREVEMTYAIKIKDLVKHIESTTKKSINVKDVEGILIPQRKLKVNYRYDLEVLYERN